MRLDMSNLDIEKYIKKTAMDSILKRSLIDAYLELKLTVDMSLEEIYSKINNFHMYNPGTSQPNGIFKEKK